MTSPQLVLIGGMAHSGTTFLQRALKYHPSIDGPIEETQFAVARSSSSISKSIKDLFHSYPSCLCLLEKSPIHLWFFENIFAVYPQSKLIAIVRDGKDFVASFLKRAPDRSIYRLCEEWSSSVKVVLRLSHAYPDNIHVVRYESLVTNFEPVMTSIFQFLDLPVDPYDFSLIHSHSQLSFLRQPTLANCAGGHLSHITLPVHSRNEQGQVVEQDVIPLRQHQVNLPLFNGSGRWKSLSPSQLDQFYLSKVFVNTMQLLDYSLPSYS